MKKERLCHLCHINTIAKGRQLYCGSWRRKTGCSYIMDRQRKSESFRKWKEKYPERAKAHQKATDKRRLEEGYYKSEKKKKYFKELYQRRKLLKANSALLRL